jgi:diguanylate cyclase (GGDEF)-like protein/PAS domain S-box-containing protein
MEEFLPDGLRWQIADPDCLASLEQAERKLRENEALQRAILEAAPDSIVTIDHQGRVTEWNRAAEQMFGYSRAHVLGSPLAELIVPPSLRERHREEFQAWLRSPGAVVGRRFETLGMRAGGAEFPAEVTVTRIGLPGSPVLTAFIRDLTDCKRTEAALRHGEERLRKQNSVLAELARERVHDRGDVCETMRIVTEAAARTLQVQRASVWLYNDAQSLIRCADLYDQRIGSHSDGKELSASEFPAYFRALEEERVIAAHDAHADPRTREFSESYLSPLGIGSMLDAPIRLGSRMVGVVCHEHVGAARQWALDEQNFAHAMADLISLAMEAFERKRAEAKVRWHAYHDALTALPNRTLFSQRLEEALLTAERLHSHAAVLFVDLDRFKQINDTLGHAAGDTLLRTVAERLAGNLRSEDLIARIGGDEFTILLSRIREPQEAATLAGRLLDAIRQPIPLCGIDLCPNASIGISIFPIDGRDAQSLLKNADLAMYQIKQQGGGYQLFTPRMNVLAFERLMLEASLRKAIEQNELVLHYQPRVEMATGRIVGAEALLRWQHPELGLVPPVRFIPLAEEIGLIHPIGEWVLRQACRQAARWQTSGRPLRVSVNVSACQFRRPELSETVRAVLSESGLTPHGLELEVTETTLMENAPGVRAMLQSLKQEGLFLSVDDFGTGYSSLAYLRRLPLDVLKVDGSFVHDLEADLGSREVVRALVQMAHALGLKVVAEGVETAAQWECLAALGCDGVQGYYVSPAVPPAELEPMLDRPAMPAAFEQILRR